MRRFGSNGISLIAKLVGVVLIYAFDHPAQADPFDEGLIERVRAASLMVPGDLPLEVRFQRFASYSGLMSAYVADAPADVVAGVIGVFQIRFPDAWIMVDAGADEKMIQWEVDFSEEDHQLVGEALQGASLIVATHEHADHIAGLVHGRWASDVAQRALLTAEQLESLVAGPDHPGIQISRARADQYLSISYDELLPIARGVVLIKAPGHSAGSQFVYVKLENEIELLLVGDVVWVTAALESNSQRPLELSTRLGEDRNALASQIQWLQQVRHSGPHIVVAHDAEAIDMLIQNGVIEDGAYLGAPN